jgi:S-adenosylmethionine:tRNA ribosyltransferase-isomerase
MKTSDFDYHLPKELIAQTPMEPRDNSRLMVVNRANGSIQHRRFHDLPDLLQPGDLLVFNDSRVMAARLYGTRAGAGGKVELLLLHRVSLGTWRALVKPGRRLREGAGFEISRDGHTLNGEVVEVHDDGSRTVRLSGEDLLDELGVVPLPPYIHQPLVDAERYQTVYSRVKGSVAAPTAGLHFTPTLLDRIRSMGAELAFVTLHVGWDSFRPVDVEEVESHKMHSEYWTLGRDAAAAINRARTESRRVVSVGTTAVRLLEHTAREEKGRRGSGRSYGETPSLDRVSPGSGWTGIFMYPGYGFQVVDALVTNFHLPRSSLLMLTSAFAGRDLVLEAYREAANLRYRFYSFGDAMLIL